MEGVAEISTIRFGNEVCTNFDSAISKEWLLPNGLGGYASSNIIGTNTRRYHGLLVASARPPWNRKLILSKLEEQLLVNDRKYELSTNKYPHVIHPKGYRYLKEFSLDPLPTFLYSFPNMSLQKKISMPHGYNAVIVSYKLLNTKNQTPTLQIKPLIASRDINKLNKVENPKTGFKQQSSAKKVNLYEESSAAPIVMMGSDLMNYNTSTLPEEKRWYWNMEYPKDKARGYEYREDLYNPGTFKIELGHEQKECNFLATSVPEIESNFMQLYSENPHTFTKIRESIVQRQRSLSEGPILSMLKEENGRWKYLAQAADSFIVKDKWILAGYPWFSVWGRDSLIALPGLTLVTGWYERAKKILQTIGKQQKNGLIPNTLGVQTDDFKSVDASLLFFYALYKYLTYTDDLKIVEEVWNVLKQILENYATGIGNKVRMDEDGLIWARRGMTWMDARVDNRCVTPREGKPVEINALWYNALKIYDLLAEKIGKEKKWTELAEKVRQSFQKKFWNPQEGYLYDVIDEDMRDASLRPNQLFATSLPCPLLENAKAATMVSLVQDQLATPYGLRSLKKNDDRYRGTYSRGSITSKDLAYHQGTVWSWLIGPYVTSLLRVKEEPSIAYAKELVESLLTNHLEEAGLGSVSEVFDGNPPHRSGGCISQAWSVAELLRCYVEDIKGKNPPYHDKYKMER